MKILSGILMGISMGIFSFYRFCRSKIPFFAVMLILFYLAILFWLFVSIKGAYAYSDIDPPKNNGEITYVQCKILDNYSIACEIIERACEINNAVIEPGVTFIKCETFKNYEPSCEILDYPCQQMNEKITKRSY